MKRLLAYGLFSLAVIMPMTSSWAQSFVENLRATTEKARQDRARHINLHISHQNVGYAIFATGTRLETRQPGCYFYVRHPSGVYSVKGPYKSKRELRRAVDDFEDHVVKEKSGQSDDVERKKCFEEPVSESLLYARSASDLDEKMQEALSLQQAEIQNFLNTQRPDREDTFRSQFEMTGGRKASRIGMHVIDLRAGASILKPKIACDQVDSDTRMFHICVTIQPDGLVQVVKAADLVKEFKGASKSFQKADDKINYESEENKRRYQKPPLPAARSSSAK